MFRLATFGELALLSDTGARVPAQRRRLALLALLAASGDRGLTRDKVLAYLWSEGSPDHARHALEQLVYATRQQLSEALFFGPDPLRLNPSVITADVVGFQQALARGSFAEAVELYRGPFLDGFHLDGAGEYERWVETERTRLGMAYRRALEQLADEEEARDNLREAVEWWRRLALTDPLDARVIIRLIDVLVRSGDRGGALNQARVYQRLVQAEEGAKPDPAVLALVEELLHAGEAPRPSQRRETAAQGAGGEAADSPIEATAIAAARIPARRGLRGWRRRTLAALVAAIPVAVLLGVWFRPDARAGRLQEDRVAVAPFHISSPDSSFSYLREGLALLLASRFTGEGGPQAIDPPKALAAWRRAFPADRDQSTDAEARVARALGAGTLLLGDVVRLQGKSLMVSAKLISLMPGRSIEAAAQGPSDSLPALADRLAAMLLARLAGEPEWRVPILTRAALPAVRAFLAGRAAYRSGRYEAAVADFSRALSEDSTLALAALELASAAGLRIKARPIEAPLADQGWWSEADSSWQRAVELAFRERQRLDSRDLAYLHALAGARYPGVPSATEQLRRWEQTVQAQPARADAWHRFGLALLYHGPSAEVADAQSRAATVFHRAVAVDSTFAGALEGLFEVAAFSGDTVQVGHLGERYLTRYPLSDQADYVRWRVATSTGDLRLLRRLRRRFDSLSVASLVRIQWTSQVEGVALDDAERAVAVLLRRAGDRVERSRVVGLATALHLNRGLPRQARALTATMADLSQVPYWNPVFRVIYALYWSGDSAEGASAAHAVEGRARGLLARAEWREEAIGARDLFVSEQWRLWQGDTALAARAVALLRATALTDTGLVWQSPSSKS
ncbi:MAG: BTAD domain-containing putative transcriptional regulator, partial [Gemmatimonadales bacterium]